MYALPTKLFTVHENMVDAFIEGETGTVCTLIYPEKWTECDNCYIDLHTQRSSNVYKSGGPLSFPSNTLCPRCNGVGRFANPVTENIRVRSYPTVKSWAEIGITIANPDGVIVCIGYMTDLPKVKRTSKMSIGGNTYIREGEAMSWGFRSRYFYQVLRRCP